jgi:hypothetical protein
MYNFGDRKNSSLMMLSSWASDHSWKKPGTEFNFFYTGPPMVHEAQIKIFKQQSLRFSTVRQPTSTLAYPPFRQTQTHTHTK